MFIRDRSLKTFSSLGRGVITKVVEKFVIQLEAQSMDRNVTFELSKKTAEWLGSKGYDEKMGARPLARVIQEKIKKPLADELLFGRLSKGGVVKVDLVKDEINLEIIKPEVEKIAAKKKPKLLTAK